MICQHDSSTITCERSWVRFPVCPSFLRPALRLWPRCCYFFGAVGDFPPIYFDFSVRRGGGGLKLSPTSNFGNGKGAAHVAFFCCDHPRRTFFLSRYPASKRRVRSLTSPKLSACSPVHPLRTLVVNIPRLRVLGRLSTRQPLIKTSLRSATTPEPSEWREREDAKAKPNGKRWQYLVVRSRDPGPAVDDNRKRACRLENIGLQTLGKSVPARRAYGDVHRVHRPMKSQMRAPVWKCHPKALANLGHQTQPTVVLPLADLAILDQLHRHHPSDVLKRLQNGRVLGQVGGLRNRGSQVRTASPIRFPTFQRPPQEAPALTVAPGSSESNGPVVDMRSPDHSRDYQHTVWLCNVGDLFGRRYLTILSRQSLDGPFGPRVALTSFRLGRELAALWNQQLRTHDFFPCGGRAADAFCEPLKRLAGEMKPTSGNRVRFCARPKVPHDIHKPCSLPVVDMAEGLCATLDDARMFRGGQRWSLSLVS